VTALSPPNGRTIRGTIQSRHGDTAMEIDERVCEGLRLLGIDPADARPAQFDVAEILDHLSAMDRVEPKEKTVITLGSSSSSQ
jgi:hypothetical protein